MKICAKCGNTLDDIATFCPECGEINMQSIQPLAASHNSSAAIAAFVMAIVSFANFINPVSAIIAVFSIAFAIAGIVNTGKGKAKGRTLAVSALIISVVTLVIMTIIAVFVTHWVQDIIENVSPTLTEISNAYNSIMDEIEKITEAKDEFSIEIPFFRF
ncbi:MAG: zinc ribbon domain-containing protein [Ruminococcaceae bacterium]|nr:zinc ribbon domain-containing protein [Oscillospiraceae bacterium]